MATQRQQRVQELLRAEISDIIRSELRDPLIGFVTVTDVEVSPDLRHARVFISALGSAEAQEASFRALRRAAKFVRGRLAGRLELRYIPELTFRYDATAERAQRLEHVLRDLADERAQADRESEHEQTSGEDDQGPDCGSPAE